MHHACVVEEETRGGDVRYYFSCLSDKTSGMPCVAGSFLVSGLCFPLFFLVISDRSPEQNQVPNRDLMTRSRLTCTPSRFLALEFH